MTRPNKTLPVAWRVALLFVLGSPLEPAVRAAAPPNVVLIMADDLNCALACYGHATVRSPRLDQLAARGVRFDRAYCQYPVCNPSRASMLSGRRPQTTRVVDLKTPPRTTLGDVVMLPEHFRKSGYRTVKLGKIFHTGAAFEDPRSWDHELTETNEAKNPPPEQILSEGWGRTIILDAPDANTWDGRLAREAVAQLDQLSAQQHPFFLAVGFRRPHTPYIAPRTYFDQYPPSSIAPLVEPAEHLARIPRLALPYLAYGEKKLAAEHRAEIVAAYYASVSFLDAQVGVILDALDSRKLWDNTIVVFTSDHGYHLGEHGGLWHKMTLFEAASRVPLLIAAPGRARGAATEGIVELVDLYPTLVELCGLPPTTGLEGRSIAALLADPRRAWPHYAETVVARRDNLSAQDKLDPDRLGVSVRTARYRFTQWPDGTRELYDYESDQHEYRNLADSPDHAAVVADHRRLMAD